MHACAVNACQQRQHHAQKRRSQPNFMKVHEVSFEDLKLKHAVSCCKKLLCQHVKNIHRVKSNGFKSVKRRFFFRKKYFKIL